MSTLMLASHDLRGLVEDVWSSLFEGLFEGLFDGLFEEPLDGAAALPVDLVTAYVDIRGSWQGRVLLATTAEGARALAAHMLRVPDSLVREADLVDAIGELANIVGGSVKSCVDGQASLSLPTVSRSAVRSAGPDALEVRATWNSYPLRVRVAAARPLIPSGRPSTEGNMA